MCGRASARACLVTDVAYHNGKPPAATVGRFSRQIP
jgi:hypothetical protein